MNPFTQDEMEGIVKAMSQKKLTDEEKIKIPLRSPGSYGKVTHVNLSPILGELPRTPETLLDHEQAKLNDLQAHIEVVFGKTSLTLKELAGLEKGSLLPLEDFCDDMVEIHVNGSLIGRGKIVAVDNHFGVQIASFTKN